MEKTKKIAEIHQAAKGYVLNPKADNQSMNFAFKDCICTGHYIVVKVLSYNNNVVRTGKRYTQTFRRIRLRLDAPSQQVPDLTVKVKINSQILRLKQPKMIGTRKLGKPTLEKWCTKI